MKLAIVCALFAEAKPLIDHFQLRKKQGYFPFSIFENDNMSLIISGVGKYAAATALSYISALWHTSFLSYLNVGIAGHKSLDLGTLCIPSKVIHPGSKKDFYPALMLDIGAKVEPLYTLDKPTDDYFEKALFDMEAYEFFNCGIRFTTLEHLVSLKVVSDNEKNPANQLTAPYVANLIKEHIDAIDQCCKKLIKMQPTSLPEINLNVFYEDIHFTQTEKIKLERLLERFQVLNPEKEIPFLELKSKRNAKAVLQSLENILIESPLELL